MNQSNYVILKIASGVILVNSWGSNIYPSFPHVPPSSLSHSLPTSAHLPCGEAVPVIGDGECCKAILQRVRPAAKRFLMSLHFKFVHSLHLKLIFHLCFVTKSSF